MRTACSLVTDGHHFTMAGARWIVPLLHLELIEAGALLSLDALAALALPEYVLICAFRLPHDAIPGEGLGTGTRRATHALAEPGVSSGSQSVDRPSLAARSRRGTHPPRRGRARGYPRPGARPRAGPSPSPPGARSGTLRSPTRAQRRARSPREDVGRATLPANVRESPRPSLRASSTRRGRSTPSPTSVARAPGRRSRTTSIARRNRS